MVRHVAYPVQLQAFGHLGRGHGLHEGQMEMGFSWVRDWWVGHWGIGALGGLGVEGGRVGVTQGKSCLLAKMRHTQFRNSLSASMRWRSAAASPMRSLCWDHNVAPPYGEKGGGKLRGGESEQAPHLSLESTTMTTASVFW